MGFWVLLGGALVLAMGNGLTLPGLRRYLAQNEEDLRRAHERGGPVDHLL